MLEQQLHSLAQVLAGRARVGPGRPPRLQLVLHEPGRVASGPLGPTIRDFQRRGLLRVADVPMDHRRPCTPAVPGPLDVGNARGH
eukprot:5474687-Pyramimonas_sp.AAC.1